jgi:N-acylneuraminate cytidylyltransferase
VPGYVVAIVPARGGSKSIPRKNIKRLGGVPLLAYSVEAGRTAGLVDRVLVSTDDEEIAELGRRYGADVPFIRPAELAQDATADFPVFEHALDWLETHEGRTPEIVVHLRPTSPIRPPDCVDEAIALLRADPTADSVRGVVRAGQTPYKMWRVGPDAAMAPLLDGAGPEPYNQPRQSLPEVFWQTGHVDVVRAETLRGQRSMTGRRIKGLVVDPAYTCDIDTEADWRRAEWLLGHFDRPLVRPRGALPSTIRLVVFDFDGVMTDNRVWVTGNGDEAVACHRGDGLGIDRLRRLGVEMWVLSTEAHSVVAARCAKLGLPVVHGVADKAACLRDLLLRRQIDPADVVYVGNDVNDLGCMALVGCSVAVGDAVAQVAAAAHVRLSRNGGDGAVRELCDLVEGHVASRERGATAT